MDKTLVGHVPLRGCRVPGRSALGLLLLGFLCAALQLGVPRQGAAAEPRPDQIEAGDVIRVEVSGRQDLSGQFVVSPAGTVTLPIIGVVNAAGRTTREMELDLSRRISLFQREIAQVKVSIAESKRRRIFVLGSVLLPGAYAFDALPNVWEAIASAGGPAQDAQLSAVEVIPGDVSGGEKAAVVDVAAAIRDNKMETLPVLKTGDTVRVPSLRAVSAGGNDVYVFGTVARQGPLPLEQAGDLLSALMHSGGAMPGSDLKRVEIVRKQGNRLMHLTVNMQDYAQKSDISGNPPLLPGDVVYLRRESPGGGPILTVIRTIGPVLGLITAVAAIAYR